jgi:hypothetical protein
MCLQRLEDDFKIAFPRLPRQPVNLSMKLSAGRQTSTLFDKPGDLRKQHVVGRHDEC